MPVSTVQNVSNAAVNGRILKSIIDFNFICDTDYGLIQYIKQNFRDDRAFKLDIVDKPTNELLHLLYTRTNINPLSVISTDENLPDIDDLYKSFFDTYKKEIVGKAFVEPAKQNFLQLLFYNKTNIGASVSISVADEIESEKIVSIQNGFAINNGKVSSSMMDIAYIKDYMFVVKNKLYTMGGKKIYRSPLQYSVDYINKSDDMEALRERNVFVDAGTDYRKEITNEH